MRIKAIIVTGYTNALKYTATQAGGSNLESPMFESINMVNIIINTT